MIISTRYGILKAVLIRLTAGVLLVLGFRIAVAYFVMHETAKHVNVQFEDINAALEMLTR